MSNHRIASRYAKSLIELAQSQGKLESVKADLALFRSATAQRDFLLMTKSPIIKADKKRKIFDAVFTGKIDSLTTSFFDLVIRKGREEYLNEIAEEFVAQYDDMYNIVTAHVTTASEVTDALSHELKEALKAIGVTADKINIIKKIDTSLIGGFILQVGDRLYDASVKSKLAHIKKEFAENTYIKS